MLRLEGRHTLRWLRPLVAAAIAVFLGYAWLPAAEGLPKAVLKEGVAGLAAALPVGSWWSLLVIPAALLVGGMLWQRTGCTVCAERAYVDLRLTALIWAVGLVGVAIGTLLGKRIARALWRDRAEEV